MIRRSEDCEKFLFQTIYNRPDGEHDGLAGGKIFRRQSNKTTTKQKGHIMPTKAKAKKPAKKAAPKKKAAAKKKK